MPKNLWTDFEEREEGRCYYCFERRDGKKMMKRHITIGNSTINASVCNKRCGDLWHEQMEQDFLKRVAFASNV